MSELGELLIGHVLGDRYRVEEVLGEGGFGVVCRAADVRREGREVAVKVLKVPGTIRGEARERLRDRFRHEAAYAARLPPHPNVVPVYEFGTYRGRIDFLVMELLRGEDLRTRLERPDPIPLDVALPLLRDAARGVGVGHQGGLVHRDVKPGNIFLTEDGGEVPQVRILDFGIAKLVDVESEETLTHVTMIGEGVFSRYYAAPEQLRRESVVTRAADVFSLGVVAFEVLTRTRLFTHEDQNRREQGLHVPTPSLRARNSEVPEAVERIVRRCLAPEPADRYADATALAEALHRECCRLREPAMASSGARDDTVFHPAVPGIDLLDGSDGIGGLDLAADDATRLADPADATQLAGAADGGGPVDAASIDQTGGARTGDATSPPVPPSVFHFPWLRRRREPAAPDAADPIDPSADLASPDADPAVVSARDAKTLRRQILIWALAIVLAGSALGTAFAAAAGVRIFGGPPPEEEAREANAEGLTAFRERDYAEALERFTRARRLMPEHPEYWNNYGYTLCRLGRHAEAIRELSALVAASPRRGIAYSNLAEAQLLARDTAAAVQTLERLLAVGPSDRLRREAEGMLARLRPPPAEEVDWGATDDYDPWAEEGTGVGTEEYGGEGAVPEGAYPMIPRLGEPQDTVLLSP